jgi:hypothetical protein
MADNPAQTKPGLPEIAWVIPALVVGGHLVYNGARSGRSPGPIAETLIYILVVVPGSALFLIAYGTAIVWLRRSPRQLGALVMVALATLAGIVACALTLGLLLGAFELEALLSAA